MKASLSRNSPLTLSDLQARFLVFTKQPGVLKCQDDFKKAQGLWIPCPNPKCIESYKSGETGQHAYTILFNDRDVPPKANPPGRWTPIGNSMSDLSLLEIIRGNCGMRFSIRSGQIVSSCLH